MNQTHNSSNQHPPPEQAEIAARDGSKKKGGKARQHCKLKGQRDALPLVASIEREWQGGKPREERHSDLCPFGGCW